MGTESVRPEEPRGIDFGAATSCLVCPLTRAFDKNLREGQETAGQAASYLLVALGGALDASRVIHGVGFQNLNLKHIPTPQAKSVVDRQMNPRLDIACCPGQAPPGHLPGSWPSSSPAASPQSFLIATG